MSLRLSVVLFLGGAAADLPFPCPEADLFIFLAQQFLAAGSFSSTIATEGFPDVYIPVYIIFIRCIFYYCGIIPSSL